MARTKEEAAGENGGSPDASRSKSVKDGGVKKAASGTGRGRGRPKGTANPKPYTPTGKPRGRPKGSFKKKDGSATTKPKTPTTPSATGEKRGRGRPRLSAGATPKTAEGSAKKRGRKPKQAASDDNDDNDVDAEADEPEVGDDAEHVETDSLADGRSSKKASPPEDEVDGDDYDSSEE